eukprot:2033052-Rhodomonas_salina.1
MALGCCLLQGVGVDADEAKGAAMVERAAAGGVLQAQEMMAELYAQGEAREETVGDCGLQSRACVVSGQSAARGLHPAP